MTLQMTIVLVSVGAPFLFLALDAMLRWLLEFAVDDVGADAALVGVSLCLARVVELVEALGLPSSSSQSTQNASSHILVFVILLIVSVVAWVGCLIIVDRRIGQDWPSIGGDHVPAALSMLVGVIWSSILAAAYVVSRVCIWTMSS